MIKISDLKKIKKTCFDNIARCPNKECLAVSIKPIGIELIEVSMSNGIDYGRIILKNDKNIPFTEITLSWFDFIKICELFKTEISFDLKNNQVIVTESKTVLNCQIMKNTYNKNLNFKFDFSKSYILNSDDLLILNDHSFIQKYAIIGNKLLSSDGNICIMNLLDGDFGEKPILYVDMFPSGTWNLTRENSIIVSEDKTMAFTHRQANGDYPRGLIKMAEQPLSNSFECNAKELLEKMKQCAMIFGLMQIKFGNDELIISSFGQSAKSKSTASYETTFPVKFDHKPERDGFRFLVKYFEEFCKCVDKKGNVKILFDDNSNVQMFRAENEKYKIFGMGCS